MNETLTSPEVITYTYDKSGNMISQDSGGTITSYVYDYRNRLTEVIEGGNVIASYVYNALDQRIEIDDNGTKTWTVYNGTSADVEPYADFNGSGTLTERYLTGLGVVTGGATTQLLARTNSGGTTAWYLTDDLGSVRDIVSSSGGELDHIVYDSFGNIVTETDPGNGDRFKFAGMQWDATTGLYYDHARDYSPGLGRFTSTDPLGFSAGDNDLYRYVLNGPTVGVDDSGEILQFLLAPVIGATGGFLVGYLYGGLDAGLACAAGGAVAGMTLVGLAPVMAATMSAGSAPPLVGFAGGFIAGVMGDLTQQTVGGTLGVHGPVDPIEALISGLVDGLLSGLALDLATPSPAAAPRGTPVSKVQAAEVQGPRAPRTMELKQKLLTTPGPPAAKAEAVQPMVDLKMQMQPWWKSFAYTGKDGTKLWAGKQGEAMVAAPDGTVWDGWVPPTQFPKYESGDWTFGDLTQQSYPKNPLGIKPFTGAPSVEPPPPLGE